MKIETYEVEEVAMNIDEGEREAAKELVESLNLEGQDSFIATEAGEEISVYRKMTKSEYFVFSALLTSQRNIEVYSDGPIPLRVLQVASHAKGLYEELQVWCPESADIEDPILVGINKKPDGGRQYYLLARWGEVLIEFEELWKMACEKVKARLTGDLKRALASATNELAAVEAMSPAEIAGLRSPSVSYYGIS